MTFTTGATVSKLELEPATGDIRRLCFADGKQLELGARDRVLITLGSMTDGATYGDNRTVPSHDPGPCPSWELWRDLTRQRDGLGRPEAFAGDTEKTAWTSFTATMNNPDFADHIEAFTGNTTGTGGLVTIRDSAWLLSFVMFYQPHFRAQFKDAVVFWGYGLRGDQNGDFIGKPMWDSTGEEILEELCGHLRLDGAQRRWFNGARIRTCRMPYITSQFMPRAPGDRPAIQPVEGANFALMGQYVELPRDTVFTVEYSVRSARAAVFALTGQAAPLPVARTDRDPKVLLRAAKVLLGG